jgi:hypothetical protein
MLHTSGAPYLSRNDAVGQASSLSRTRQKVDEYSRPLAFLWRPKQGASLHVFQDRLEARPTLAQSSVGIRATESFRVRFGVGGGGTVAAGSDADRQVDQPATGNGGMDAFAPVFFSSACEAVGQPSDPALLRPAGANWIDPSPH